MNKRQKAISVKFITVIVITVVAVVAMINFKDWVNRSEAMRAMEQLGQIVLQYQKKHGSVPPVSYVDRIKERLQGNVRLGKLYYRALWIDFDSPPDTILAYTEISYRSLLFRDGYIVLRLNGSVEWMGELEFEALLAQHQSQMEIQMLQQVE